MQMFFKKILYIEYAIVSNTANNGDAGCWKICVGLEITPRANTFIDNAEWISSKCFVGEVRKKDSEVREMKKAGWSVKLSLYFILSEKKFPFFTVFLKDEKKKKVIV